MRLLYLFLLLPPLRGDELTKKVLARVSEEQLILAPATNADQFRSNRFRPHILPISDKLEKSLFVPMEFGLCAHQPLLYSHLVDVTEVILTFDLGETDPAFPDVVALFP